MDAGERLGLQAQPGVWTGQKLVLGAEVGRGGSSFRGSASRPRLGLGMGKQGSGRGWGRGEGCSSGPSPGH